MSSTVPVAMPPRFLDEPRRSDPGCVGAIFTERTPATAALVLQDALRRGTVPASTPKRCRWPVTQRKPRVVDLSQADISIDDTPAAQWYAAAMLEVAGDSVAAADVLDAMNDVSWREERALRLEALARNLIRAGRAAEAWLPLRYAAQVAATRQTLVSLDKLMGQASQSVAPPVKTTRRIAVLGNGVLDFWAGLRPALLGYRIGSEVLVGGYDQYQQEILDPASRLAEFQPEVVVLATNWRSPGLADETVQPDETVKATMSR